ncbi:unnamed protein product [Chondrus crispus]|uniref:DDE Tnp4 domain-containing protein n=1 Tax=Chondrus crispus TaxID=2769 RepID=R7Q8T1_CHOCR|nr:unnamed protein product [Chondrus crispus]CDF34444.1 unnamed protein product [Chondrus crispus]|eukprot:XP_005714263.1 unnamed protein product [Chondrus crispus]
MATSRNYDSPPPTYSPDSSDDENLSYLVASGTLPGFPGTIPSLIRLGSRSGKRGNLNRDFDAALNRLKRDYFSTTPLYCDASFDRRFRMPHTVFNRLYRAIEGEGLFVRRKDALNRGGIHPLQRMVAAIRMLAYGAAADSLDEYLSMSEDSVLQSLKSFCSTVIQKFGIEYLREPNEADLRRILAINAARGFPGKPTIVLEAICDGELWIWHAFFGSPGSLNDINVLDRSPTMERIIAGEFPASIPYTLNKKQRTMPYYLADGIYPSWAIFMKTIKDNTERKEEAFAKAQKTIRKDIERAFGVLVARFHILQNPSRLWKRSDVSNVMVACIILHNMIVESRRDNYQSQSFTWESESATRYLLGSELPTGMWASMVSSRHSRITSKVDHFSLKRDLIEHIWNAHGSV